jgi:hypothetical protein
MNAAFREAAAQARQKPVQLTQNQEVSSLVAIHLMIPLQLIRLKNNFPREVIHHQIPIISLIRTLSLILYLFSIII